MPCTILATSGPAKFPVQEVIGSMQFQLGGVQRPTIASSSQGGLKTPVLCFFELSGFAGYAPLGCLQRFRYHRSCGFVVALHSGGTLIPA